MWIPSSLLKLIENFKKLPGIGERSAERIVFHLLINKELMQDIEKALEEGRERLTFCSLCHTITDEDPCPICKNPERDSSTICVVENPQDVFLLERLEFYKGKYHVLGGVLSPIEGIGPEDLNINDLIKRVKDEGVKEIILALSPTVEGDTTAYYIAEKLKVLNIKVTRIARGLPTGTDISLIDTKTLKEAIMGRREI
jgi:recombination protein RecR